VALLGHGRGRVGHAVSVRSRQLGHVVLFLPLHASVLEPDLDLSLSEAERVRDLDAAPAREVAVEVKLLLEFQRLVARVRLPRSLLLEAEIYTTSPIHSVIDIIISIIIVIIIRLTFRHKVQSTF